MTKREMTEIFLVFKLAYPSSEIFKGGIEQLKPTIELWVKCLPDIDKQLGLNAAYRLCRTSPYPPTIAMFKQQADAIAEEVDRQLDEYMAYFSTGVMLYGSASAFLATLPPSDMLHRAASMNGALRANIRVALLTPNDARALHG